MKDGADPETPITMSHEGSATVSLRSTVGQAARLSVEESERSGPRFVRYRPFRAAGDMASRKAEGASEPFP
jgi:hypothetical protein